MAMKSACLSDDERPLVFGKGGHLEYKDRAERPEVVETREKEVGP